MGATFLKSNPRETPCETLTVCSVGLMSVPVLEIKVGGGTSALGAAIALRLGAGASDPGLECVDGTLPDLTIRGAVAGSSASSGRFAFAVSEEVTLLDFPVAEESPLAAASISSCNFLGVGIPLGCELGADDAELFAAGGGTASFAG